MARGGARGSLKGMVLCFLNCFNLGFAYDKQLEKQFYSECREISDLFCHGFGTDISFLVRDMFSYEQLSLHNLADNQICHLPSPH